MLLASAAECWEGHDEEDKVAATSGFCCSVVCDAEGFVAKASIPLCSANQQHKLEFPFIVANTLKTTKTATIRIEMQTKFPLKSPT